MHICWGNYSACDHVVTGMKARRRFPSDVLSAIRKGMIIGLRAGAQPHRFVAVWAVVVEGRVFVRSWSRSHQPVPNVSGRAAWRDRGRRPGISHPGRAHKERAPQARGRPCLPGEIPYSSVDEVRPRPRARQVEGYDHGAGAPIRTLGVTGLKFWATLSSARFPTLPDNSRAFGASSFF